MPIPNRDTLQYLSKMSRVQEKFLNPSFKLPATIEELIEFETKQINISNKVNSIICNLQKLSNTDPDCFSRNEIFEKAKFLLNIQTQIMQRIKEQRRIFILEGLRTRKDAQKLLAVLRQKLLVQSATASRSDQDDLSAFIVRVELKLQELMGNLEKDRD